MEKQFLVCISKTDVIKGREKTKVENNLYYNDREVAINFYLRECANQAKYRASITGTSHVLLLELGKVQRKISITNLK